VKGAVALLAVLLVSCAPAITRTASASQPASGSCRLPISLVVDAKGSLQGAFVDFPSGKVAVDPTGAGGAYYSVRFKRWLPAGPNAISADGTRYAYLDPWTGFDYQGSLHVVDMATGKDRRYVIGSTTNQLPFLIVSFGPDGVWLTNAGYEAPGGGLFLLDLATGTLTETHVPGDAGITQPVVGDPGIFWFTDPGPNPEVAAIGFGLPEEVLQLTISDGKSAIWFAKRGSYVQVLGTDLAGHPIIGTWVNGADYAANDITIWLASSPSAVKQMGVLHDAFQPIADSHGVWFGSSQGIYLYSEATGMKKITDKAANPAGTCL
jgi:WD40 repeat protein